MNSILKVHSILSRPQLFRVQKTLGSTMGKVGNEVERGSIEINNLRINYEMVGNGPHAILCLPGALGSIETDFRPQLIGLNPKKYTIIGWDPPGYGKSRPPNRDFSGGAQVFYGDAKAARTMMQMLKFNEYSMLGWSDGGITALILAALFPKYVRKMVIWGSNAFINETDIECIKSVQDVSAWSPKMKAPMIDLYGEEYFLHTWSNWVEMYIQIYKNGGDICKDLLQSITCPTLIVHGKKDPMLAKEHPQFLKEHIKHSRLVIYDEGKHNIHLRYAEKFNDLVDKFLSED